ncbi:hypothetical protein [Kitasatospora sp. NPDC002965]|uniref:hypothetical protein n=1 Tax=Kitasatospora sp. NPDC002965 TaxID=3154775 RepID=UPI00339E81F6
MNLLGCGHPDKADCDGYCAAKREVLAGERFADLADDTLACGHRWTGTVWDPVCVQGCPPLEEPDSFDDDLAFGIDFDGDDDFGRP